VVVEKEGIVLKVAGSNAIFELKEDSKAKVDGKTALARLRQAVEEGQERMSVTGRVEGWHGHFPPFLNSVPKKPRVILVKEFAAEKETKKD
jgi:hypothetical protein